MMNERDARQRASTTEENLTNEPPASTRWSQQRRQHQQHQSQQQQQQQPSTATPSTPFTSYNSQAVPFRSQLDAFSYPHPSQHSVNIADPRAQGTFDMSALAGHLPTSIQPPQQQDAMHTLLPYERSSIPTAQPFASHLPMSYGFQAHELPSSLYDPNRSRTTEMAYGGTSMSMPLRSNPLQGQDPYMPLYGSYGSLPSHHHVAYNSSAFAQEGLAGSDVFVRSRQISDAPAPIPAFPRGPPRRPKQSGHALWVGNLPPTATVVELKDHFSREATKDIESLFLISKSNCAFVNYRTEAACIAAVNRFHDSRFNGVRLVCRLRRGSNSTPQVSLPTSPVPSTQTPHEDPATLGGARVDEEEDDQEDEFSPVIVGRTPQELPESSKPGVPVTRSGTNERVPEKFFIVKSLTVQDLEASVRNGIWSTQSHNEDVLNHAYEHADNVYLIFSANKSGEYFGYARMASPISAEPLNLNDVPEFSNTTYAGSPQSISTPATTTAPRGHIIDDSARGTIFWEAELSDAEEGGKRLGQEEPVSGDDQQWGRQFKIEWHSTSRLPFFRTRGLRNPWNSNREVKIARDGTELEPGVGRRLTQMFHRPPPPMNAPASLPGGAMPLYR